MLQQVANDNSTNPICLQTSPQLLRRAQTNRNRRASNHPCVVLISDKEYLDHHVEDQPLECELRASDANGFSVVKVKGKTTGWASQNAIESGVTTIFASNSVIDDDTKELIIPTGSTINVSTSGLESPGHDCQQCLHEPETCNNPPR